MGSWGGEAGGGGQGIHPHIFVENVCLANCLM